MSSQSNTILISAVIITGSTLLRKKRKKETNYMETITFGFLLVFVLLILAVPFPTFAKGLAYLGLVGAFAVNGPEVFKLAQQIGGK